MLVSAKEEKLEVKLSSHNELKPFCSAVDEGLFNLSILTPFSNHNITINDLDTIGVDFVVILRPIASEFEFVSGPFVAIHVFFNPVVF